MKKKNCNFLSFGLIFLGFFLPHYRAFYVVLEKEHGAGEKGMAIEKKGME